MDVLQLDYILDLLKYRELTLFRQLTTFLHKRTKEDKANPFEVLMYESSDLVQNLAQAYGERQALQFCIESLASMKCGGVKATFALIFKIFAVDIILRDLGFYIADGILCQVAAEGATKAMPEMIKELAKKTGPIIENMNVPVHALHTPIISDYVKYNEGHHLGEVVQAKL